MTADDEKHLTFDELRAWADSEPIGDERERHLDECDLCRELGGQLLAFDPAAATSPRARASKSGAAMVWAAAAGVLLVLSIGVSLHMNGQRRSLELQTRVAIAAESARAELERKLASVQSQPAGPTLRASWRAGASEMILPPASARKDRLDRSRLVAARLRPELERARRKELAMVTARAAIGKE